LEEKAKEKIKRRKDSRKKKKLKKKSETLKKSTLTFKCLEILLTLRLNLQQKQLNLRKL